MERFVISKNTTLANKCIRFSELYSNEEQNKTISHVYFKDCILHLCNISSRTFENCVFENVVFKCCSINGVIFTECCINNVTASNNRLQVTIKQSIIDQFYTDIDITVSVLNTLWKDWRNYALYLKREYLLHKCMDADYTYIANNIVYLVPIEVEGDYRDYLKYFGDAVYYDLEEFKDRKQQLINKCLNK